MLAMEYLCKKFAVVNLVPYSAALAFLSVSKFVKFSFSVVAALSLEASPGITGQGCNV